ncbi:unnamed protein product [Brachionus calyciflorus]|uniref:Uncharacterized protein n=1 Tax=Brachionus calyciflorus TaxID=104777 RepID=A0A814DGB0_9BILA|nr:unnamed protein product [Brachionus calyciflorus]
MLKNTFFVMLIGVIILVVIEGAEVKKSVGQGASGDSDESSGDYDYDKKKRSLDPREKINKMELYRQLVERLSNKYDDPEFKSLKLRGKFLDDNLSGPYPDFDEDEYGSEYDSDSEDDLYRKKKSLMKKKRFREFFRKRNALQQRFRKFRANF